VIQDQYGLAHQTFRTYWKEVDELRKSAVVDVAEVVGSASEDVVLWGAGEEVATRLVVGIVEWDGEGSLDADEEGAGEEGAGEEGAVEGAVAEGAVEEGVGEEGVWEEGAGDDGAGEEGVWEEEAGDEGAGEEGAGEEVLSNVDVNEE
jgi:hypothetical protein